MSQYFIVEVKDKHVTRHEIFLALVEKLGLGKIVTVEPASQQSVQRTADKLCEHGVNTSKYRCTVCETVVI